MTLVDGAIATIGAGVKVHDVTVPLRPGMAVWPGDPEVELTPVLQLEAGEEANVARLSLSTHTGTHVDAPWHFLDDGQRLDEIPLDRWIGPCLVVETPAHTRAIRRAHLTAIAHDDGPADPSILIVKTRSNDAPPLTDTFDPDFAAFDLDAARWLVEQGITLVGIDTPSVEDAAGDGAVHRTLLGGGVLVVEGLALRGISPGLYTLVCLPMPLQGADGAPARVLLVEQA